MERYRFGDVTLVRFVDSRLESDAPTPVPEWAVDWLAPSAAQVELAFAAFALEVDGQRVIVDPWLVTDGSRQGPDAADHADRLEAELTGAGFAPADVDVVVLTHFDGIGWSVRPGPDGEVPMFPNARYVTSAAGADAVRRGEIDAPEGLDVQAFDEVATDAEISPSLRFEPSEGHTPGHATVRVRSGDADVALAGHLFLYPNQVADPTVPFDTDPEQAAADRGALLDDLAAGGGVLFAQLLGGAGGGRVVADGAGHRLEPV